MRARALLVLACLAWAAPVHAAGRVPYGGQVTLPVNDWMGVADPHQARTSAQRLVAGLAHCRLVGLDAAGRPQPQLARSWTWERARHELLVDLAEGATFHDGSPIRPADVVASLRRLQQLGVASPVGRLVNALEVATDGPTGVRLNLPRAVRRPRVVLELLARPEVAVLRGGQPGPGRGCGPFAPGAVRGSEMTLTAHAGHPVGRPYLERVVLRQVAGPAEQVERFYFKQVDLAFEPSHRYRQGVQQLDVGARATVFAIPGQALSGGHGAALRNAVWTLAARPSLARYVEWEVEEPASLWPSALDPSRRRLSPRRGVRPLADLVIAYPKGDAALAGLARVVRDRLRPLVTGTARAIPIEGLSIAAGDPSAPVSAAEAQPRWDLALVALPWAASSAELAAWEVSQVLGVGGLRPVDVLAGKVRGWADAAVRDVRVIPLLHATRPVFHRGAATLERGRGVPALADSWKGR